MPDRSIAVWLLKRCPVALRAILTAALLISGLATFDSPYVEIPGMGAEPFRGNGARAAWLLGGCCLLSAVMTQLRLWWPTLISALLGLATFAKYTRDRLSKNQELMEMAREYDPAMLSTYENISAGWGSYLIITSLIAAVLFSIITLIVRRKR